MIKQKTTPFPLTAEEVQEILKDVPSDALVIFATNSITVVEPPVAELIEEEKIPEKWRNWTPRKGYTKVFRSEQQERLVDKRGKGR